MVVSPFAIHFVLNHTFDTAKRRDDLMTIFNVLCCSKYFSWLDLFSRDPTFTTGRIFVRGFLQLVAKHCANSSTTLAFHFNTKI